MLLTELEHHANIVPWQILRDRIGFKIVAAPIDATGGLDLARVRAADHAAHQAGRGDAARQRHRRDGAGRGDRAAGACQGRQGSGRWLPGGAAPAGRCAGARIATSMSSPATRPMARPASACSMRKQGDPRRDAAVPGRRRHDPQRHLREDDRSRSRRRGSRPARPTSPARSASRARSTISRRSGRDAIVAHEAALTGYGVDQLAQHAGRAPGRRGAAPARHPVVRSRGHSSARSRAACSTSTRSRCAPAIIARSR